MRFTRFTRHPSPLPPDPAPVTRVLRLPAAAGPGRGHPRLSPLPPDPIPGRAGARPGTQQGREASPAQRLRAGLHGGPVSTSRHSARPIPAGPRRPREGKPRGSRGAPGPRPRTRSVNH